jgi:hypothetical protein
LDYPLRLAVSALSSGFYSTLRLIKTPIWGFLVFLLSLAKIKKNENETTDVDAGGGFPEGTQMHTDK